MRASRSVLIVPLLAALAACAGPAPIEPPGDGPLVAFYGDSYTLGTGIADPDDRWSTLVSEERGWREVNPSVNGLGFVNQREGAVPHPLDVIIDADPDVVVVTMGLNDAFSMPARAGEIEAAIDDDLGRLREELPEARLVVSEPFWYLPEPTSEIIAIDSWVGDAADAVGADRVAGAMTWLEDGTEGMLAPDGLHPSEAGHRRIADILGAELDRIGL